MYVNSPPDNQHVPNKPQTPKIFKSAKLETLRADSHTRHLPVLVLTVKHFSVREQHDLSQAAQVMLPKASFTPDRLIEKVRYLERVSPLISPSPAAARHEDSEAAVEMSQFRDDFEVEARECLSRLRTCVEQYAESGDAPSTESAARAAHTLDETGLTTRRQLHEGMERMVESL